MPLWLQAIIRDAVVVVIRDLLAAHGATPPTTPPTTS